MKRKILHKNFYFILLVTANIIAIPLAVILACIKWLFNISFIRIRSSRIGPLIATDIFLRRIKLGIVKDLKTKYIGIATKKVINKQLVAMLQRKIKILQISQPKIIRIFTQLLANKTFLPKLGLFQEPKFRGNEYREWNDISPMLTFTKEEEKLGTILRQQLGIEDNWFICFHARDSAYGDTYLGKRDAIHDFRNCSIENYLKTAEYITSKGGAAVRMGAMVAKPLPTKKARIIDYASKMRSEFGDIYLLAKCKFNLGNTAGINGIPNLFGVPAANANVIPITRNPPPGKHDLFIPKKIWNIKEQCFLTFKEMIESPTILSGQNSLENIKIYFNELSSPKVAIPIAAKLRGITPLSKTALFSLLTRIIAEQRDIFPASNKINFS